MENSSGVVVGYMAGVRSVVERDGDCGPEAGNEPGSS
jgi:hypothetical protein